MTRFPAVSLRAFILGTSFGRTGTPPGGVRPGCRALLASGERLLLCRTFPRIPHPTPVTSFPCAFASLRLAILRGLRPRHSLRSLLPRGIRYKRDALGAHHEINLKKISGETRLRLAVKIPPMLGPPGGLRREAGLTAWPKMGKRGLRRRGMVGVGYDDKQRIQKSILGPFPA